MKREYYKPHMLPLMGETANSLFAALTAVELYDMAEDDFISGNRQPFQLKLIDLLFNNKR